MGGAGGEVVRNCGSRRNTEVSRCHAKLQPEQEQPEGRRNTHTNKQKKNRNKQMKSCKIITNKSKNISGRFIQVKRINMPLT